MSSSPDSADPAGTGNSGARGSWLHAVKAFDARRPDLPGEHAVVLGAGVLLLLSAGRSRSIVGRLLRAAAGGALIGRAASGTGGVARVARAVSGLTQHLPPR